jgi:hypothetical protein
MSSILWPARRNEKRGDRQLFCMGQQRCWSAFNATGGRLTHVAADGWAAATHSKRTRDAEAYDKFLCLVHTMATYAVLRSGSSRSEESRRHITYSHEYTYIRFVY